MRIRKRLGLSGFMAIAVASVPPLHAQESDTGEAAANCADRPALEAELVTLRTSITRIAMSGSDRRDKRRASGAGKAAAGAAAGLLLPFGIGLALKGTTMLAEHAGKQAKARKPQPPSPAEPDVPAMMERQHQLELQLAQLSRQGCAPALAEAAKGG